MKAESQSVQRKLGLMSKSSPGEQKGNSTSPRDIYHGQ
jgi:hypothetical protein